MIQSQKGGPVFIESGAFSFKLKVSNHSSFYFKCEQIKCKATLVISREHGSFDQNFDHCHLGNIVDANVKKTKSNLAQLALLSARSRPQEIITETLDTCHDLVIANLLPQRTLSRTIRKRRQGIVPTSAIQSVTEIFFPEEVLKLGNNSILIYDKGTDSNNRMLIFFTPELLSICRNDTCFNMDGTFKIAPTIYYQLYSIHCWYNGEVIPVFYALLNGKTETMYVNLLTVVSRYIDTPSEDITFMIDLEMAVLNALVSVFPQCHVKACSFHFRQVIPFIVDYVF